MTLLLLLEMLSSTSDGWCGSPDAGWKAVGVRAGISATARRDFFHQYEAYATYGLPWSLRADSGWGVALQLNAAAGALQANGETGFIAALGSGVILDKGGKGVALELGGDLNKLTKDRFGLVYFNGHLLFAGHIGIAYRFASGPGIAYRFQHMSNGGLNGNRNTGLDLHMLGLSWNFP
jgi:hypothetical protein